MPDLLVKLSFDRFFFCRHPDAPPGEALRQTFPGLFFPLIHLMGVNPLLTTQFIDRALSFEGFQHHFHFEFRAIRLA